MTIQDALNRSFGKNSGLEQIQTDVFRLYAPFFHEDGDMYSIYIETHGDHVTIRDFGNTLMRVSYTFDLSSKNKQNILRNIVNSNMGEYDDGELLIHTTLDKAQESVFQFAQIVSKVSNIDILSRETIRSMFFESLNDFIMTDLKKYHVQKDVRPSNDDQLVVDYVIQAPRPIFLFGVNGDARASKAVISCLTFQKERHPFRSVIVHEDMNALSLFNRKQITNVADKQFYTLDGFRTDGLTYLDRELSA